MNDYWSVIDDIRTVLENTQSIYPEHRETLRTIGQNYNDAVGEINNRLRQAAGYLRKGNTGEAIRLAETEPNLFDAFAVLDFPERQLWEDVLSAFELPPATAFHREIAKELNDAVTQTAPLEPLLRKHRFLALALAPLSLRLATLREIAKQDPLNPAWIADIETYERERLLELKNDVDAATGPPDLSKLTLLETELSSPDWRIDKPEELLNRVRRELYSLKSSATISSLRALAEQLLSAYKERSLDRALPLRESWNSLQSQLRTSVPSELQQQVRPVFQWLSQDDTARQKDRRFREELRRLEDALEKTQKLNELLRIRDEVVIVAEDCDAIIPEELEERINDQIAAARTAAASQQKFLVYGGLIVALFVFAMIGVLVTQASKLREVDAAVAEIRAVIDNHSPATRPKSFETLQKYKSSTNPFSRDPAVREEVEKLEKLLEKD